MDVADVTAASRGGTKPRFEASFEPWLVDVADDLVHEMTATNIAIAIDGESCMTGITRRSGARIIRQVPMEVGVDGKQSICLAGPVIVRLMLVGIDPQVDFAPQKRAQFLDSLEVFADSHNADAILDSGIIQFTA